MTTIAAFATFNHSNNGKIGHLSSVHILSDSKWSWDSYAQNNMQKIFYSKDAEFVIAYSGDARAGFEILSMVTVRSSTDAALRSAKSLEAKMHRINILLDDCLQSFPKKERNIDLELFGVFHWQNKLQAFTFYAKSNETTFIKIERTIYDQTNIWATGSGGAAFLTEYDKSRARNVDVPESAIYFNSFIQFLKSNADPQSSVPPQAVVIDQTGNVKPVSIKLGDQFYKLGNVDDERANYKKEIDYRDEQFEFLHADGRIKGGNRKKYHFKPSS